MCGIAGAIGLVTPEILTSVAAMSARQQHRGPDGGGLWSGPEGKRGFSASRDARTQEWMEGAGGSSSGTATTVQETGEQTHSVVLAHRRLAIIDLDDVASQPMHDPDSGCVMVYNGEVYNFSELRRDLEGCGVSFRSRSDTEVVLRAYTQWGTGFVERLRGMFAFALWDPRAGKVILARDRLGIKPLYVTEIRKGAGRTLLFASELRSLLACPQVPRRIDPKGLATYLWNGFVTGPGTLLDGVRMVAPGTIEEIQLDDLGRKVRRFWSTPRSTVLDGSPDQLKSALQESVAQRMVSDVPLGVFLSGGIDSSAVAALAVASGADNLKTFCVGFEESEFDESSYGRAVADGLGTDHQEICISEAMFQSQLDDALRSIDQPTFDAINTYLISRAVREAGLTVALAGTGGDELFGGYTTFVDLPAAQRVAQLSKFVPAPLLRGISQAILRWKMGASGAIDPQVRWGKLFDLLRTGGRLLDMYQVSYSLFRKDFIDQLAVVDPFSGVPHGLRDPRHQELEDSIRGLPNLQAISLIELSCFVGDRLLRDTDAASMAVSLEVRVPFLDHEVVEAACRLETEARYSPLGSKQIIRDIALQGLDPKIFDRPKSGFVLPIENWCRNQLEGRVASTLLDAELCAAVGLDPTAVAQLWEAFKERAPGIYWSRVWSIFVLLWWAREYDVSL